MVEITVVLDAAGVLGRLSLKGHAGDAPKGENVACAAVTLLVRSLARLVAARSEWKVDGNASQPGDLSLEIQRRPEDTDEWLRGITDILLRSLADIDEDYPSALSVNVEEKQNGS